MTTLLPYVVRDSEAETAEWVCQESITGVPGAIWFGAAAIDKTLGGLTETTT